MKTDFVSMNATRDDALMKWTTARGTPFVIR